MKTPSETHLRAPIFLLGSHKSGTSLLRSLLDGHPDLFVFPTETHFFQFSGFGVDYRLRRAPACLTDPPTLIESLQAYLREHQVQTDPFSDNPGFRGYDADRCLAHAKGAAPNLWRDKMAAYLRALWHGLNESGDPGSVRFVEKSVEHAEFASLLKEYFPDCRFIHIIRDPYATLTAIRKAKSRRGHPDLLPIAASLYNSYYYLFRNQQSVADYLVLRFEDLVLEPEKIMHEVADFLGLEFNAGLMSPTSQGAPWKGNSTSKEGFEGISKAPLEHWKKTIHPNEIRLMNAIAPWVMNCYGYDRLDPTWKWILPAQRERFRAYFKNRMAAAAFRT